MPIVRVETLIDASPTVCFDLARDVDVHVQTTGRSGERAVAGVTSGKMGLGDSVTFEAKHLGFRWRLTSKIVLYEFPTLFVDEMVKGPFKRMRHEHRFEAAQSGTLMVDTLDFQSPVGLLVLGRYMELFLVERGVALKRMAETRLTP
ncbi:MAG TPA: SRPBCC family protein [Fimbriimonadaceae bacterium]|jgi:ligand-binding SRPBCC domain-containing protein